MHRQQAGHADALDEQFPHAVAWRLGRDHHHVHIVGQDDLAVVDAEAVRHHEGAARLEVWLNLLPVYAALDVVRDDHHDHVGLFRDLGHVGHAEPGSLGNGDGPAAGVQPHHDVLAVVLQVKRVGMSLAAVADDADGFSLENPQVGVLVVVDVYHS